MNNYFNGTMHFLKQSLAFNETIRYLLIRVLFLTSLVLGEIEEQSDYYMFTPQQMVSEWLCNVDDIHTPLQILRRSILPPFQLS